MSVIRPVFVVSDIHLGASRPEQEHAFFAWLDRAAAVASCIIVNGDLFDFWFEYRNGIPRGYGPILQRLREIVDGGVSVTLMGGNHDWWGGSYLRDEIGLEFLQQPVVRDIAGHRTLLAHGDGLGEGDLGYRVLSTVLRSSVTRIAYSFLPVPVGDRLAGHVSNTEERWSRWNESDATRQRARSDALEAWATERLRTDEELDLVLLGHTHLPLAREVAPGRWYVNSGDWVFRKSYVTLEPGCPPRLAEWDGGSL